MAYTQADLDALDAEIAIVRTVKATTTGDQSTTFRDLDDLLKLRALMSQSVAAATGTGVPRTRYATVNKGV